MIFRKEDHQALQSMYHFKIKVDPTVAWAIPDLVQRTEDRGHGHPDPQQALRSACHSPLTARGAALASISLTNALNLRSS